MRGLVDLRYLAVLALSALSVSGCGTGGSGLATLPIPQDVPQQALLLDGLFVGLEQSLASLGHLSAGTRVTLSLRPSQDLLVDVFVLDSEGSVIDGASMATGAFSTNDDLAAEAVQFDVDRDDDYFFYFALDDRAGFLDVAVAAAEASELQTQFRQFVLLSFTYPPSVTFADRTKPTELCSTHIESEPCSLDLGLLRDNANQANVELLEQQQSEVALLRLAQPLIEGTLVDRVKAIFEPLGIGIATSSDDIPVARYSTVFFVNKAGPASDSPFEAVKPISATTILYGEAGVDLGNRIGDDHAVVYVGSLTGVAIGTSVNDLANFLAHAASHEIGHLLGLVHAVGPSDLMRGAFNIGLTREINFTRSQVMLEDFLVPFAYQDPAKYFPRITASE